MSRRELVHRFAYALERDLLRRHAITFAVGQGALHSIMWSGTAEQSRRMRDARKLVPVPEPQVARLVVLPHREAMHVSLELLARVPVVAAKLRLAVKEERDLEIRATHGVFRTHLHKATITVDGGPLATVEVWFGSPTMYIPEVGLVQGVFVNREGWLPRPEGTAFILFVELMSGAGADDVLLTCGIISLALDPVEPRRSLLADAQANVTARCVDLIRKCRWWSPKDAGRVLGMLHRTLHAG